MTYFYTPPGSGTLIDLHDVSAVGSIVVVSHDEAYVPVTLKTSGAAVRVTVARGLTSTRLAEAARTALIGILHTTNSA